MAVWCCFFFFQAEDGIRARNVTGVQTCALPIWLRRRDQRAPSQCSITVAVPFPVSTLPATHASRAEITAAGPRLSRYRGPSARVAGPCGCGLPGVTAADPPAEQPATSNARTSTLSIVLAGNMQRPVISATPLTLFIIQHPDL